MNPDAETPGTEKQLELHRFRWWYKGKTPDGNTMSLQGHVMARDSSHAGEIVEKDMRKKWPDIKWMQGRDVEGEGDWECVRFGPTVQQLKGRKKKTR